MKSYHKYFLGFVCSTGDNIWTCRAVASSCFFPLMAYVCFRIILAEKRKLGSALDTPTVQNTVIEKSKNWEIISKTPTAESHWNNSSLWYKLYWSLSILKNGSVNKSILKMTVHILQRFLFSNLVKRYTHKLFPNIYTHQIHGKTGKTIIQVHVIIWILAFW